MQLGELFSKAFCASTARSAFLASGVAPILAEGANGLGTSWSRRWRFDPQRILEV